MRGLRGQMQFLPMVIGIVVVLLIGFAMANVVGNSASSATQGYNMSAGANMTATNATSLVAMYPMLFVVFLIAIMVGAVVAAFASK